MLPDTHKTDQSCFCRYIKKYRIEDFNDDARDVQRGGKFYDHGIRRVRHPGSAWHRELGPVQCSLQRESRNAKHGLLIPQKVSVATFGVIVISKSFSLKSV